jgi:cardiolipin synthase
MRFVPNLLTALRLALIPAIGMCLLRGNYRSALALFTLSALSDALDGMVARRWKARTDLGALLDPVADKLTMVSVAAMLWFLGWLPGWFAAAIAARDVLIVCGVIAYRQLIGPLRMAPSLTSKLNTAMEFLALLATLGVSARLLPEGRWQEALFSVTLITIALSALDYFASGTRMALDALHDRPAPRGQGDSP